MKYQLKIGDDLEDTSTYLAAALSACKERAYGLCRRSGNPETVELINPETKEVVARARADVTVVMEDVHLRRQEQETV
jgi:hypothetical protein